MKYSKLMKVIHHGPLQLMNILTLIYWIKSKNVQRKSGLGNKYIKDYENNLYHENVFKFLFNIRVIFKYEPDGPRGLLHHYNTLLECIVLGLDCEDYARFIKKYLKKFYNIDCVYFGIVGDKIKSWHYDCYFVYDGKLIVADQGNYKIVDKLYRTQYLDLGSNITTTTIDYEKSAIKFIQSDKYMKGDYKNLKAFWICEY